MDQSKIEFLRQRAVESAIVKDPVQGYVVLEPFNLAIQPDILQFASRSWAEHYHEIKHIDAIVGLPDAGSRLVSLLGEMLRVKKILPSKRAAHIPGAWHDIVSYRNRSFTTGAEDILSHIGFVKPGETVLLVDDVIAAGETAVAAIKALQHAQVNVIGMCVLFDKVWQGGLERVKQETGIEPYSLIRIESINEQGKIVLQQTERITN